MLKNRAPLNFTLANSALVLWGLWFSVTVRVRVSFTDTLSFRTMMNDDWTPTPTTK